MQFTVIVTVGENGGPTAIRATPRSSLGRSRIASSGFVAVSRDVGSLVAVGQVLELVASAE